MPRMMVDPDVPCPNCGTIMDEGHVKTDPVWIPGREDAPKPSKKPSFRVEVFRCTKCGQLTHLARKKAD